MKFELQVTDKASDARTGIITTDHGQIKTPIFMPVGTVGSVKGVHFEELRQQVRPRSSWETPTISTCARDSKSSRRQADCISSTAGTVLSSPTVAASRYSLLPESASSKKRAASSVPTSMAASISSLQRT